MEDAEIEILFVETVWEQQSLLTRLTKRIE